MSTLADTQVIHNTSKISLRRITKKQQAVLILDFLTQHITHNLTLEKKPTPLNSLDSVNKIKTISTIKKLGTPLANKTTRIEDSIKSLILLQGCDMK